MPEKAGIRKEGVIVWFDFKEAEEVETLTCLETGAQVIRSGEGDHSELWWRGNVIDRPLEQDEMKLAGSDGQRHFEAICEALISKGELAGDMRAGDVTYPIPGE